MHEIYMLAVLFHESRRFKSPPTREARIRAEQAFYDLHAGGRAWRPSVKRYAPVPLVLVAFAVAMELTHLLLR